MESAEDAARRAAARLVEEAQKLLGEGRPTEAEERARRAVSIAPSAEAMTLLGTTLAAQGDDVAAEAAYERASELDPSSFKPLTNLGHVRSKRGEHARAIAAYERAIALEPRAVRALAGLGAALRTSGRRAEAERVLVRSMEVEPSPQAALELFELRAERGDLEGARGALDEAMTRSRDPRLVAARRRLDELEERGAARLQSLARARDLAETGEHALAARELEACALADPSRRDETSREALDLLFRCLSRAGDREGARRAFERALEEGDAIRVLAQASLRGGIDEESRSLAVRGAAERDPTRADLAAAAAIDLLRCRQVVAASVHLERARSRHPSDETLADLFASTLVLLGRQPEAAVLDREVERSRRPTPNALLRSLYTEGLTRAEVKALHRRWAAPLGEVPRLEHRPPQAAGARKIRVGYLSGDFYQHSVGRLIWPALAERDRSRFEVVAYATSPKHDELTARIEASVDRFREVWSLDDDALARAIHDDAIDVLVDLSGHTAMSRLEALARRPARVSVSYLGYPATTGLDAIDYRIGDAVADPPGSEADWVEELVRLPRAAWCFVGESLPARAPRGQRPFTFGSFNSVAKVTPDVVRSWASILARVPSARLVLKSTNLLEPEARAHWQRLFASAGADPSRVDVLSYERDPTAHLAAYGRVDLALDPFPYAGTMTTCEALAMGVPVVTMRGDRHVSRVGASLLAAVGLGELVAGDVAAYEDLAVRLATNEEAFAAARAKLASGIGETELGDATGFARAFDELLASLAARGPRDRALV